MSKANVLMFFGVNCVGKSAITQLLNKQIAGSVRLHGSMILRNIFGGIPRSELERLTPEYKKQKMLPVLEELFSEHDDQVLLYDSHLVVPIRSKEGLVYENMWSLTLAAFTKHVFYIYCNPNDILRRRISDYERTSRVRNLDIQSIIQDQQINLRALQTEIAPHVRTTIIDNSNCSIEDSARYIASTAGV